MKKLLSLTILIFVLFSCNQTDDTISEPENEPEANTLESYLHDANQLYFEEIFQDSSHPNLEEPILNSIEVDKIFKIIEAVYKSRSPQRDTVFDVYQIHKLHCYGLSSIHLRVDTERGEIQNLAENIIPTGESSLDNLLTTYNFDSVAPSRSYPQFPWMTLYTDEAYNMIPLEKEFNDIGSIEIAEFEKGCGNWSPLDITLSRNDNTATITFSLGWGDCPSGCMNRKYWEFEVSNGTAVFTRTY